MHYKRNTEARLHNNRCRKKRVLYILSVSAALVLSMQYACTLIIVCGLSGSITFFHIIS
jgi:hypothetical protein